MSFDPLEKITEQWMKFSPIFDDNGYKALQAIDKHLRPNGAKSRMMGAFSIQAVRISFICICFYKNF